MALRVGVAVADEHDGAGGASGEDAGRDLEVGAEHRDRGRRGEHLEHAAGARGDRAVAVRRALRRCRRAAPTRRGVIRRGSSGERAHRAGAQLRRCGVTGRLRTRTAASDASGVGAGIGSRAVGDPGEDRTGAEQHEDDREGREQPGRRMLADRREDAALGGDRVAVLVEDGRSDGRRVGGRLLRLLRLLAGRAPGLRSLRLPRRTARRSLLVGHPAMIGDVAGTLPEGFLRPRPTSPRGRRARSASGSRRGSP